MFYLYYLDTDHSSTLDFLPKKGCKISVGGLNLDHKSFPRVNHASLGVILHYNKNDSAL